MRDDLLHIAVLVPLVACAVALGLLGGWSDGALGAGVLGALAFGLFLSDPLVRRIRTRRERRHHIGRPHPIARG